MWHEKKIYTQLRISFEIYKYNGNNDHLEKSDKFVKVIIIHKHKIKFKLYLRKKMIKHTNFPSYCKDKLSKIQWISGAEKIVESPIYS